MGEFQMFEILLPMLYQFIVAKYFHKFYIFQKSYFKESWLFAISYCFCKFEEWKRFAQFLVDKPTLLELHMV